MKDTFKVVFDAERMKYKYTGLYFYCLNLGKALLNELPAELQLYFYKNVASEKFFGAGDFYLNQHSYHKFLQPNWSSADIYHANYQLSSYLPRRKKSKIILTVHDLNFIAEGKSEKKIKKYSHQLQQNIDSSSTIVAISNYVKDDLLKHFDLKGRSVHVIYNGCNIDSEKESLADVNSPLPHSFIFSIGTIARKKNFHKLLYVLKGNGYHLVISGIVQDAKYLKELYRIAEELQVTDRLHVTGPITEEQKFTYLKHCVLFAFPSIAEGFGLPVIEAMYFGKKVLLSKHTCLPEIGGHEAFYFDRLDEEYLVEFGEKEIQKIVALPSREKEIKDWASQFTWEKAAKEYIKLYRALL